MTPIQNILFELGCRHSLKIERFVNQTKFEVSLINNPKKKDSVIVIFPDNHLDDDHVAEFIRYAKRKL